MSMFPKIQSPCPYKSQLATVMDGDFCRMCKRNVVDLSPMSDGERVAFLKGCEEEVCVTYKFPVRPALAAAALAASVAALPVAAMPQDDPSVAVISADEFATDEDNYIVVGGIKDPKNVELIGVDEDRDVPELPVIVEPGPARPTVTGPAHS